MTRQRQQRLCGQEVVVNARRGIPTSAEGAADVNGAERPDVLRQLAIEGSNEIGRMAIVAIQ
jgi:hypothetical protein